ncbi:MAG: alpha/beta fold hydrolase [Patescibacteria group bacterium]|nr:alpha/beta fold hydrolase [Patescibacteria group bacterium]
MMLFKRSTVTDLLIVVLVPLVFMTTLGLFSAVRPRKLASSVNPDHFDLRFENVSLVTEDRVKLAGWYIPKQGDTTDSTIIVLHGYPTDKGDMLARTKFLVDDFNLLLLDFRYFGESEGSHTTVGVKEAEDLTAAVRYLEGKGTRKIGVYGISMGGAVALMGLDDPGLAIDAVAAEASYADLKMMTQEVFKYLGPLGTPLTFASELIAGLVLGVSLEQVSPVRAVRGTDKPVLLIHSREDKLVGFENAERIKESLAENPDAQYLFFETGDHGQASVEFAEVVGGFFRKHLSND